jgi:hypothetical protein
MGPILTFPRLILPCTLGDPWKGAFVSVRYGSPIISWKRGKENGMTIIEFGTEPVSIIGGGISSYKELKRFIFRMYHNMY